MSRRRAATPRAGARDAADAGASPQNAPSKKTPVLAYVNESTKFVVSCAALGVLLRDPSARDVLGAARKRREQRQWEDFETHLKSRATGWGDQG